MQIREYTQAQGAGGHAMLEALPLAAKGKGGPLGAVGAGGESIWGAGLAIDARCRTIYRCDCTDGNWRVAI